MCLCCFLQHTATLHHTNAKQQQQKSRKRWLVIFLFSSFISIQYSTVSFGSVRFSFIFPSDMNAFGPCFILLSFSFPLDSPWSILQHIISAILPYAAWKSGMKSNNEMASKWNEFDENRKVICMRTFAFFLVDLRENAFCVCKTANFLNWVNWLN